MKSREEEAKLDDNKTAEKNQAPDSNNEIRTSRREFIRKAGMIGGIALTQFALLGGFAKDAYAACPPDQTCPPDICDTDPFGNNPDLCRTGSCQADTDLCEGKGGDPDWCSTQGNPDPDDCPGGQCAADTDICEGGLTCPSDADQCSTAQCKQDTDMCESYDEDLCHEGGCGNDTDYCFDGIECATDPDLCHEGGCGNDTDSCEFYPDGDVCDPDDGDMCNPTDTCYGGSCPEDTDVCLGGNCGQDTDLCDGSEDDICYEGACATDTDICHGGNCPALDVDSTNDCEPCQEAGDAPACEGDDCP